MSSKQLFFVLIASLVVIFGLSVGLTKHGATLLGEKGDLLVEQKLDQAVLASRQQAVVQAQKDIDTYSELADIAKSIVPQEKDQARTVREIDNIARAAGIPQLGSITFPNSALGEIQRRSGAGRQTTPIDPAVSQLVPVEGTAGLYALEITVESHNQHPVLYSTLLSFLEGLENNRRTAHVTSINLEPIAVGSEIVEFSVTLNVYIKP